MPTTILISSNADNLRAALAKYERTATVEAEYGDAVVNGSIATLAHHGPRKANPCPCQVPNFLGVEFDAIGVSHIDLDTLGGIMAVLGIRPTNPMATAFWRVAAYVDVNGVHKLDRFPWLDLPYSRETVMDMLHAYYAWSEKNRIYAPRDGSALDITEKVMDGVKVWTAFLNSHPGYQNYEYLVEGGKAFAFREGTLNAMSLKAMIVRGGVLFRASDRFVNHLYTVNGATFVARAVVGYNTETKAITVSVSDPLPGFSCREYVQSAWGAGAGGHDGIAGSPRDRQFSYDEAEAVAYDLSAELVNKFGVVQP